MRPLKTAPVDLSVPQELTVGLIERLKCPEGKAQAFLRDRKAPALRVRVTTSGAKAYVFEAKLGRQTIRRTIGDVRSWTIEGARTEANRLRVQIDQGADPREVERQKEAERLAKAAVAVVQAVTVGEAWSAYIAARRPRWGEHHYKDHIRKSKAGGTPAVRGTRGRGETVAGPIYPLLSLKLRELTPTALSRWAEKETAKAPTSARLSWRLVRGFLSWCAEHPQYAQVLPPQNPAKAKVVREVLGKPKVRQDALQREQLAAWFDAVRQLANPMAAAYLQVLLLTGARPGEILALRWADVDIKWRGLTIRDKVEGERIIPLTSYVASLLGSLPRVNEWVFASPSNEVKMASKAMSTPHKLHDRACRVAGIEGLTLHGLRRSFKSLTEWLEIPAGIVAQIMGHKPSATAEKHYTVRPLDLLRLHHEKIEAWILAQAGIEFDPQEAATNRKLRAVK
ncbi:MAG: preprotein translocase [Curvibacter sp. GWA2_64_110]|nr:MAG: preprotein translocase [Curvibacter sp. GWA2_64_110]HCY16918.1 preprotein translocase [Curvibacter sp.]